jgi:putative redox protein
MPQLTAHLALETVAGDGLRFRAVPDSGNAFVLDSGPGAQAPSPPEALIASLGACTGMDVIAILRKQRQAVTGYELELIGERREEHPRSFTAIEVVHRIRGNNLNPAFVAEAIRLSETKYCSVHATLAPGVVLTSRYEILPATA